MAEKTNITQAVILAGGRGIRLRPLTDTLPKPMVSVCGRPFLEHLVELLRENGIREIVMLLGYLPEQIIDHFGDGRRFGLTIKYSVTPIDDETGSRVKKAEKLLSDNFLLLYCDNYWPLKLERLWDFYRSGRARALVTVYSNRDGLGEYGYENNIQVLSDGSAVNYDPTRKAEGLNGVDIGFFIVHRNVISEMPAYGNFSFERVILPKLIAKRELAGFFTDHPYYSITNLERLKIAEEFLKPKKVVFLDRDGVINKKMPEHDYVKSWKEFEFLPGVREAIGLLKRSGYLIYVVSNQAGVGRGLMSREDLEVIHSRLESELLKTGASIDGFYYCLHRPEDNCDCRKPKAGLLLQAARENYLDLTKTVFIGDDGKDLEAGKAAGSKTILVGAKTNLLKAVTNLI